MFALLDMSDKDRTNLFPAGPVSLGWYISLKEHTYFQTTSKEVNLTIGKVGNDFTYFLQLHTHWWWIAQAVFTWTLKPGPDSMYRCKFHSLNGGNTVDQGTPNQCSIIWSCDWDHKKHMQMQENLRSRNLKLGLHCIGCPSVWLDHPLFNFK
jgi:hypothetical protein